MPVKNKCFAASFTVEAAMVMPCVVMVLFLMFSVTFYLHDLVVLESLVYESCMSEEELDERQIEDKAREQTFFVGHISFEVEEQSLSKKVSCSAQMYFFGDGLISSLGGRGFLQYSKSVDRTMVSEPTLIRMCHIMGEE